MEGFALAIKDLSKAELEELIRRNQISIEQARAALHKKHTEAKAK